MVSTRAPNVDAVAAVIDEAARTLVLPRFSRLSHSDIESKATPADPDDLVTIVDREVEEQLSKALTALAPGSAVVGEEGAHRSPELLNLLASDQPLWVIDPIDGTRNFAAGNDGFGIMVAWVNDGRTDAAWIALPARKEMFAAEAGGGAFVNGKRIHVPPRPPTAPARGALHTRYMPQALGEGVDAATRGRYQLVPHSGCAAIEYTDILRGERDFLVYYRLLPWDHAAPALILAEAGARVVHADGTNYTVRSKSQVTLVARDTAMADRVRAWLKPPMAIGSSAV
jgi:fructose-1,6-bisphosphatase/inositol monophosphatase family enzyme